MADILIDNASDIVSIALASSNMLDEFAVVKDYANFRLIVELKKWGTLRLFDNTDETAKSMDIANKELEIVKTEPIFKKDGSTLPPTTVKCDVIDKKNSETTDLSERDGFDNLVPNVDPMELASLSEPEDETASDDSYSPFNSHRKKRKPTVTKLKKTKQPFQCEKCDYKTFRRDLFKRHQRVHYAETKRKKAEHLQCEKCDFNTFHRHHFMRHQLTHSDERPFSCTLCPKRYKEQYSVDNHIRAFHLGEKNYKCEKCDYKCTQKTLLRSHMAHVHSEAKPFKCQYCDHAVKSKGAQKLHEQRMHLESIKMLYCDQCPFKTVVEKRYQDHKKAHENNAGEVCTLCGKIFMLKEDLRMHLLRNAHKERKTKDHPCPRCGKIFKTPAQVRGHMGMHTGDREYRCRLCGSGYTTDSMLKKHFRNHHPTEKMYRCAPCDFETDIIRENKRHLTTLTHMRNIDNSQD